MIDIPYYKTFIKIEQLTKGYSRDKKYYIETFDGKRLLLCIADITEYDRKKAEFEMMECIVSLNVPMPQPVDFGMCNNKNNIIQAMGYQGKKKRHESFLKFIFHNQYLLINKLQQFRDISIFLYPNLINI